MNTRRFGRLGWQVSELGFGAWALGGGWGQQSDADSAAALRRFMELGGNLIDTAQVYGDGRSEQLIAQALQRRSGGDPIYVAAKSLRSHRGSLWRGLSARTAGTQPACAAHRLH